MPKLRNVRDSRVRLGNPSENAKIISDPTGLKRGGISQDPHADSRRFARITNAHVQGGLPDLAERPGTHEETAVAADGLGQSRGRFALESPTHRKVRQRMPGLASVLSTVIPAHELRIVGLVRPGELSSPTPTAVTVSCTLPSLASARARTAESIARSAGTSRSARTCASSM